MKKPKETVAQARSDRSVIAKLVQDFGLLLIADDFERYAMDQSLLTIAQRTRTKVRPYLLSDAHLEKFLPLIPMLGIEVTDDAPLIEHVDVLDRFSKIEAFVKVLCKTVDFRIEVKTLLRTLRRKFKSSKLIAQSYRREHLISMELEQNCRDVMWIVREFHVENEKDEADVLWDVNLWTILLDAHRLHAETGMVHFAFYERLEAYQKGRGAGSPKKYKRAALAALLAECFEDFCTNNRKAVIHDRSEDADPYKTGWVGHRQPAYESDFADVLITFSQTANVGENLSKDNNSLDIYRKILRKRAQKPAFRVSERLKSSMQAPETELILRYLDTIKV